MAVSQLHPIIFIQKRVPTLLLRLHQRYSKFYLDYVAQWVYPHIIPLAYLRYQKTVFPVSKVCISELMVSRGNPPCLASNQQDLLRNFNKLNGTAPLKRDPDVDNILE